MLEIAKTTDGPTGVGTVYASTVKDAGMKSKREFRITAFEAPTKIRWAEQSKNLVTATGGRLRPRAGGRGQTRVRIHNVLEGHGIGKLIAPLALRAARKDATSSPTRSSGRSSRPSRSPALRVSGTIWLYPGGAGWRSVTLPSDVAHEIRAGPSPSLARTCRPMLGRSLASEATHRVAARS